LNQNEVNDTDKNSDANAVPDSIDGIVDCVSSFEIGFFVNFLLELFVGGPAEEASSCF
jgi:hypothetical protein